MTPPPPPGSIQGAADWLVLLTTGSAAIAVGIIAIAGLGFLMLSGRLPLRRGVTTLLGVFLLFGAAPLARSLLGYASFGVPVGAERASRPSDRDFVAGPVPNSDDRYAHPSLIR